MRPYVRKSERVLFGAALAFSLLAYALIGAGIGVSVHAARQAAAAFDGSEYIDPDLFGEEDSQGDEPGFEEIDPGTDGDFEEGDEAYAEENAYLAEGEDSEDEYAEDGGLIDPSAEEDWWDEGELTGDEYADYEYGEPGVGALASMMLGTTLAVVLVYLGLIVAVVLGLHILAVGWLMGNGIRVGERQFPELWKIFAEAAAELGVKKLPAFYLVQSGGVLNAFATRLFTRNYVAIYSELAECLYDGDAASISFVVAHELVHVKRNHALKNLVTLPAELVPFLKGAWRRACEYTCDAGGWEWSPAGAEKGLVLLAAGKKLASRVSADDYVETFKAERSVWKRVAELAASHPHLPKRIIALRKRAAETI